jgi:hypothetical protein
VHADTRDRQPLGELGQRRSALRRPVHRLAQPLWKITGPAVPTAARAAAGVDFRLLGRDGGPPWRTGAALPRA